MILVRILGFPFSVLYGCITAFRNFLYDSGLKKSYVIPGKSIVIGNLSMGGTGKSPHTLYLWKLLSNQHEVDILSRGYGRTTKGLLEVQEDLSAEEVGDEPLMFKKRVKQQGRVVVSESRKNGVGYLRSNDKNAVILLDDAFQHRKVKAGFSVLLTDYSKPFYSDFVVPAGTLREWRCGKKRAACVIVTKCPESMSDSEKQSIVKKLNLDGGTKKEVEKPVFFSQIIYGELIPFGKEITQYNQILLVTGIANPKSLENHLKRFCKVDSIIFSDHHQFTRVDVDKIHSKFDAFTPQTTIIVTTEKDFVRLQSVLTKSEMQQYPWYYQSITVKVDREEEFQTLINNYLIRKNK